MEKVQSKAERFFKQDYSQSVSQARRANISLTMLCKIINEIANVPNKEILIPADTRLEASLNLHFT